MSLKSTSIDLGLKIAPMVYVRSGEGKGREGAAARKTFIVTFRNEERQDPPQE